MYSYQKSKSEKHVGKKNYDSQGKISLHYQSPQDSKKFMPELKIPELEIPEWGTCSSNRNVSMDL
ncbi:hypothetical protein HN51_048055 [Arachis hypogaea]